jgi:hypothetical protein
MAIDGGLGYLFFTGPSYSDPWIPDPLFPDSLKLSPNLLTTLTPTIQTRTRQAFSLYGSAGYLGTFDLAGLPAGFRVTAVTQFPLAPPQHVLGFNTSAVPPGGSPLAYTGFSGNATWDTWNTGNLGLSSGGVTTYDPTTMSIKLLSLWDYTFTGTLTPEDPSSNKALRLVQYSTPLNSFGSPIQGIPGPATLVVQFTWSYNTDDCAGLTPITDLVITNPVTGQVSWTPNGDGTVIDVVGASDSMSVYLDNSISTYTPTLTGNLLLTLYAATEFPICLSNGVPVNVTVTVPFDFTMGQDGVNAGINLGGAATLQFIGNPSGIYTLTPNQFRDVLYERIPAPATNPVKIPKPFVKSAFLGE